MYLENRNQTCSHGGHSGTNPLIFLCYTKVFCQDFFIKKYSKNLSLDLLKMFCAPQTFRPRIRVWPKRTLKGETGTNCRVRRTVNLSKCADCMWNMTKWNSHSCFCLLADPYTQASMHSEWDFNVKKTVQETYDCVLQGLPLLHSLCVENWLLPFHCDLINN